MGACAVVATALCRRTFAPVSGNALSRRQSGVATTLISQLHFLQSQRVSDHRDGTQTHRGAGDNGAEQPTEERIERAGGDWDAERVVDEREEKILPDVAHHSAAQMN